MTKLKNYKIKKGKKKVTPNESLKLATCEILDLGSTKKIISQLI